MLPLRMVELRHNPYVGTFFNVSYQLPPLDSANDTLCPKNPLLGVFRHSPAHSSTPTKPANRISRLQPKSTRPLSKNLLQSLKQVSPFPASSLPSALCPVCCVAVSAGDRGPRPVPVVPRIGRGSGCVVLPRNCISSSFVKVAKCSSQFVFNPSPSPSMPLTNPHWQMPVTRYTSDSSLGNDLLPSPSESSPCCSICLAAYVDGDSLLTLACGHCYHSDCVNRWFLHRLGVVGDLDAFSCPQCRCVSSPEDEEEVESLVSVTPSLAPSVALSVAPTVVSVGSNGFSSQAFLALGQSLYEGYDLLSDTASDSGAPQGPAAGATGAAGAAGGSPSRARRAPFSPPRDNESVMSGYSDCGVPLFRASPRKKPLVN